MWLHHSAPAVACHGIMGCLEIGGDVAALGTRSGQVATPDIAPEMKKVAENRL